jgi:hypothetical protein
MLTSCCTANRSQPVLAPLAAPMGRHRSASVPIDPMPDRTRGPQDGQPTEREGLSADLRAPSTGSFQIHTAAQDELINIDESESEGELENGPAAAPPSILSLSTDSLLSISSPASPGSGSPCASLLSISDTGADWDAQEGETSWESDPHSHSNLHRDSQREEDLQEYSLFTVATNGSPSLPSTLTLNRSPFSAVAGSQQSGPEEGDADDKEDACSVLSVSSFGSE